MKDLLKINKLNQTKILYNFECRSDSNSSLEEASSPAFKLPQTAPIFQASHIRSSQHNHRLISDQYNKMKYNMKEMNKQKQNLNNVLQNRKQSIFIRSISLGLTKSSKSLKDRPIPLFDEIKENDGGFLNNSSDDSNNIQLILRKRKKKHLVQYKILMIIRQNNINKLYLQLQCNIELNENDSLSKKALKQLEPIYQSFNQQKFDDFEIKAQYHYYYNKQNAENIIFYTKQDTFEWQTSILQKGGNLCYIPFYIFKAFLD